MIIFDGKLSDRISKLNVGEIGNGEIAYWMQREQRIESNWAFYSASFLAEKYNKRIFVVFNLLESFSYASKRHFDFLLCGLEEVEFELFKRNIKFDLLLGNPVKNIPEYTIKNNISVLVTDFNPLKEIIEWKTKIAAAIKIPFFETDAHNIVPCKTASDKAEFAAYTIRPKIQKRIPEFMTDFPAIPVFNNSKEIEKTDWKKIRTILNIPYTQLPIKPGRKAALNRLDEFISTRLQNYKTHRNNPNLDALSGLSPYLHFGTICSQEILNKITACGINAESVDSFLDELVIRKELSDNFCFYNNNYDNFSGLPLWAQKTLNEHRIDKREFIYSLDKFEYADTHDELWNAAQQEMIITGKMHSYLRMYWAKKLLEWTETPEEAIEYAIYLNDKYEFDGRDPNGYAGIAWSVGGIHDRAWSDRPVFGKIRYMNYNGCKKKFDIKKYIFTINNL
ncbi:MAG: deoxyribodipyrimidine photo-lyase [Ignavibacteria bacterium]|nr:deoxyribodipyrimidine photo-lyase [Ignavibacteria bacterium]